MGLKALGMDHGNPTVGGTGGSGGQVWFVSDEHVTFAAAEPMRVGTKIHVLPAHVDPTVTLHERLHVVRGDEVLDTWAVDLRGW